MSPWGVDYIFILVARGQISPQADCASSGATNSHVPRRPRDRMTKRRTAIDRDLPRGSGYESDHNRFLPTQAMVRNSSYPHGPSEQTGGRTARMHHAASLPPHRSNPLHRQGVLPASRTLDALLALPRRSPRPKTTLIDLVIDPRSSFQSIQQHSQDRQPPDIGLSKTDGSMPDADGRIMCCSMEISPSTRNTGLEELGV